MTRKVVITYEVGLIQFWGDNAEVEPNADLAAYEKRQIESAKHQRRKAMERWT